MWRRVRSGQLKAELMRSVSIPVRFDEMTPLGNVIMLNITDSANAKRCVSCTVGLEIDDQMVRFYICYRFGN